MTDRATSPMAIDVDISPADRQGGQEPETNRVLTLITDSHGEPILQRSFRCLTQDITLTIGIKRGETEQPITFPRGSLDPRNRKMAIVDRPYIRTPDGNYRFLGYQDVSHAIQFRSRIVRDRQQDEEMREYTTRTAAAACVLPLIEARDERGRIIQIMDPRTPIFRFYQTLCAAATWVNEPPEEEESSAPEGGDDAPPDTEAQADAEVDLDDLPS